MLPSDEIVVDIDCFMLYVVYGQLTMIKQRMEGDEEREGFVLQMSRCNCALESARLSC
jgi:hypothetical protein